MSFCTVQEEKKINKQINKYYQNLHIGIEKLLIQIPLNLFHMEEVMT